MEALPPLPPVLPDSEGPRDPRIPLLPVWRWTHRKRHLTIPAAVPVVFLAAGAAVSGMQVANKTAMAVVTGVMAIGSVVLLAPHKWDRRIEQVYAILSAAAASGWMIAVTVTGLNKWELPPLGVLALAWGIPFWAHKRPRGKRVQGIVAQWDAWWRYYAPSWNLAGSGITNVIAKGVIDTLRAELVPGKQALSHVEQILPLIESALRGHVAPGMTRAEADPRDPSQVLIHLKRKNPHDKEFAWDPALAPKSVTGTMPICRAEDGTVTRAPMLTNWFIIGRLRSGKSNELSVTLASITGCVDAAKPWLIDLKGGRSARPWKASCGWVAITIDEARLLLRCAVDDLRAKALLEYDGEEQLTPTPERPAQFVVIDEAHGVLSPMSGDAECQRLAAIIASEGGAVNYHLIIVTQYGALQESVGTEQIRGNLPARMCFAVAEARHGAFALPDWDKLDASRLENKGEFYWRLGPDGASAPGRGPHMPHPLVREISARNAALPRPPRRLYAGEWQETFDTNHERLPEALQPGQEADVEPFETPQMAEARIEREVEEAVPDWPAPLQPLPPEQGISDELTRRKQQFATLITNAPPGGISPKQLRDETGFSSGWTAQQLAALAEHGAVTKLSRGRWAPLPGRDLWQVMEAIREERARLYTAAREKANA